LADELPQFKDRMIMDDSLQNSKAHSPPRQAKSQGAERPLFEGPERG
jgi:hypothetical protein